MTIEVTKNSDVRNRILDQVVSKAQINQIEETEIFLMTVRKYSYEDVLSFIDSSEYAS
jgi:hypothetical protein